MGPENNVGLGGCWITECLLPYLCMVTVSHIMVGLERMLDYRGVGLARFHCIYIRRYACSHVRTYICEYIVAVLHCVMLQLQFGYDYRECRETRVICVP